MTDSEPRERRTAGAQNDLSASFEQRPGTGASEAWQGRSGLQAGPQAGRSSYHWLLQDGRLLLAPHRRLPRPPAAHRCLPPRHRRRRRQALPQVPPLLLRLLLLAVWAAAPARAAWLPVLRAHYQRTTAASSRSQGRGHLCRAHTRLHRPARTNTYKAAVKRVGTFAAARLL